MDRVLEAQPRLTALYAAALARSVRVGKQRMGGTSDLPQDRHRLDNVTGVRKKVDEFQRLMGGPQTDLLPSGYVHTLAFPVAVSVLARPDFPLPLVGMIHLRNEVEHLHPIAPDERLSVTAWVENLLPHRSGTQVDVVVDVESASALVWKGRSTYLAKGTPPDPAGAAGGETAAAVSSEPEREEPPHYPTREWTLNGDTGRRYAAMSGDYNPIHLSAPSARALGLKRPIAHGMYLASRIVAESGPGEAVPFRWTVEFRAPVSLPSKVAVSARVRKTSVSQWQGAEVTAWDPRRRRTHLTGRLERLGGPEAE